MGCDVGGVIGIMDGGSLRSGKCEMRGIPGGGRIRENSEAREVRGVCFWDRAINTLVSPERSDTMDCGVIS